MRLHLLKKNIVSEIGFFSGNMYKCTGAFWVSFFFMFVRQGLIYVVPSDLELDT